MTKKLNVSSVFQDFTVDFLLFFAYYFYAINLV